MHALRGQPVQLAQRERKLLRIARVYRLCRLIQARSKRYDARYLARKPHYGRYRLIVDAVLRRYDDARRLEIAHREMRRPHRIIGLHRKEYGVERLRRGVDVAQVLRVDRRGELAVLRGYAKPARLHCVHMRRPCVYQRYIPPRPRQIPAYHAADCARSHNCQSIEHTLLPPLCVLRLSMRIPAPIMRRIASYRVRRFPELD